MRARCPLVPIRSVLFRGLRLQHVLNQTRLRDVSERLRFGDYGWLI